MRTKLTERQQRFIAMAAAHADDFKTRVAQHDQQNSFPYENVDAMKASGYTACHSINSNRRKPHESGGTL